MIVCAGIQDITDRWGVRTPQAEPDTLAVNSVGSRRCFRARLHRTSWGLQQHSRTLQHALRGHRHPIETRQDLQIACQGPKAAGL